MSMFEPNCEDKIAFDVNEIACMEIFNIYSDHERRLGVTLKNGAGVINVDYDNEEECLNDYNAILGCLKEDYKIKTLAQL